MRNLGPVRSNRNGFRWSDPAIPLLRPRYTDPLHRFDARGPPGEAIVA